LRWRGTLKERREKRNSEAGEPSGMLKYGILKNPKKIQKMKRRGDQTVVCSRLEPLELAVWFFRSEEGKVGSWPPPEETGGESECCCCV
jgi:hypothetical protein